MYHTAVIKHRHYTIVYNKNTRSFRFAIFLRLWQVEPCASVPDQQTQTDRKFAHYLTLYWFCWTKLQSYDAKSTCPNAIFCYHIRIFNKESPIRETDYESVWFGGFYSASTKYRPYSADNVGFSFFFYGRTSTSTCYSLIVIKDIDSFQNLY